MCFNGVGGMINMKKPSEYNNSDWETFDQEHIIKKYKHRYDYIYWILGAIGVIILLMAFQSNMTEQAMDSCNLSDTSFDVCWKTINP
jgi:hypothetical protein